MGPLGRPDWTQWGEAVILSDREGKATLERGSVWITPDPRSDPSLWSSTALDLRLGEHLAHGDLSAAGAPQSFSPADPAHVLTELIARFVRSLPGPSHLHPEGLAPVHDPIRLGQQFTGGE